MGCPPFIDVFFPSKPNPAAGDVRLLCLIAGGLYPNSEDKHVQMRQPQEDM